nr:SDR family oxidoreductase [uncultured Halomonas sp.]
MMLDSPFSLHNKVALVSGLANRDSIAFGCAQALNQAGARVIVTYMPGAERFVLPLADELGNAELMPCDVQDDAQLTRLFTHIADRYGGVDVVVHSIAPLRTCVDVLLMLHGKVFY